MNVKVMRIRIIIGILLLFCVGWLLVYLVNYDKTPFLPIKYTFNSETGVITFNIDPRYDIDQIHLSEGYFPQPTFSDDTTEVSFGAFDLPVGHHEFVYFTCFKKGSNTEQLGVEIEILHQPDKKVLIQVFENGRDFPGYRRQESFNY